MMEHQKANIKVLIINTVRFRLNGITSVIMNYFRQMNKDGIYTDFVVINEISNEYKKELEGYGSSIYCFSKKKNPFIYIKQINSLLSANHYDIIHVHGNSALMVIETLIAKKNKVPVRIVHSHNTTCTHTIQHKMLYPLFSRSYTKGLACGRDAGKWLFHGNEFEVLANGIDLEKFRYNHSVRKDNRKKLGVEEGEILIGHIGNFVKQKNHEFLIDFFMELHKKDSRFKLLLVSDGVLLEQIKDKVSFLGLSDAVIFYGKSTHVQNLYQAMDVFVLPSLHEGLPVVMVEAQAAGVKCFVSETVSKEVKMTDLVEFLPIKNPTDWVNRILPISMDKQDDRMKECLDAQKEISFCGYDIKKNADKLRNIYLNSCN